MNIDTSVRRSVMTRRPYIIRITKISDWTKQIDFPNAHHSNSRACIRRNALKVAQVMCDCSTASAVCRFAEDTPTLICCATPACGFDTYLPHCNNFSCGRLSKVSVARGCHSSTCVPVAQLKCRRHGQVTHQPQQVSIVIVSSSSSSSRAQRREARTKYLRDRRERLWVRRTRTFVYYNLIVSRISPLLDTYQQILIEFLYPSPRAWSRAAATMYLPGYRMS